LAPGRAAGGVFNLTASGGKGGKATLGKNTLKAGCRRALPLACRAVAHRRGLSDDTQTRTNADSSGQIPAVFWQAIVSLFFSTNLTAEEIFKLKDLLEEEPLIPYLFDILLLQHPPEPRLEISGVDHKTGHSGRNSFCTFSRACIYGICFWFSKNWYKMAYVMINPKSHIDRMNKSIYQKAPARSEA